jgi:hypothetical protein
MRTAIVTTAKLFVTDYASYNEGSQFKFGHWVELDDFNDVEEFLDYVKVHFEKCDEESPLTCGGTREELMITDYEGFPEFLYCESLSKSGVEKIYKYIELDFDNLTDGEKLSKWNEYQSEEGEGPEYYDFDEDFFNTHFQDKPMEAARATQFGSINWSHSYIMFDGYGNLESFDSIDEEIDEELLINWIIDKL